MHHVSRYEDRPHCPDRPFQNRENLSLFNDIGNTLYIDIVNMNVKQSRAMRASPLQVHWHHTMQGHGKQVVQPQKYKFFHGHE